MHAAASTIVSAIALTFATPAIALEVGDTVRLPAVQLLDGRTVLHWRDRLTNREVLVSRAVSPGQYAVRRAAPLHPSAESGASIKLKGSLKEAVKPYASHLSSCLETAPKPVVATVTLRFDSRGRPARLFASTDQPAPDLVDCVAAALADVTALPDTEGTLEALRMR
jgi:hypothetical protein